MNLIKEKIKEIELNNFRARIKKEGVTNDILNKILSLDVDILEKIDLLMMDFYKRFSYLDSLNNLNEEELSVIVKSNLSPEIKNIILLNNGQVANVIKDNNVLAKMLRDKVSNDNLLLYAILLFDVDDKVSKATLFNEIKLDSVSIGNLINKKTAVLKKLVKDDNFKDNFLEISKKYGVSDYSVDEEKLAELLEVLPELILDLNTNSFEKYKKILKNEKHVGILTSPGALNHKWGISKKLVDTTDTVKANGDVENFSDHIFAFELIDKFRPEYIAHFANLSLNIFLNPLNILNIDDGTKKLLGKTAHFTDIELLTSRFFNHFFKKMEPTLKREAILRFAYASYEDRKLILTLLVNGTYITFKEEALKVIEKLEIGNDYFLNVLNLVVYYPELTKEILKKSELSKQDILIIKYLFTMPAVTNRPLTIDEIMQKLKEGLLKENSSQKNKLGVSPYGHIREKLFNEYEASVMFLGVDGTLETYSAEDMHHSPILASYIEKKYGCRINDINNASIKLAAVGEIVMVVEGDVMNIYLPSKLTPQQLTTLKSYLSALKEPEKVEFYGLVINKVAETDLNKIDGDYGTGYELNHGTSMNLDILSNIIENTFDNETQVSIKR